MTRSEQLFEMLFDVIDELTEHETSDVIFDTIVDHLALETEYHMGQVDTFRVCSIPSAMIIPQKLSHQNLIGSRSMGEWMKFNVSLCLRTLTAS